MTDRTFAAALLDFMLHNVAAPTAPTSPLKLRLMTANGTSTAAGTELSASGYTAGGSTMGTPSFGASSAGVASSSNAVSWTASGSWTTVTGIEIWDTAGTPKRLVFGALTANITGVVSGDTVQFAAAAITADASAW